MKEYWAIVVLMVASFVVIATQAFQIQDQKSQISKLLIASHYAPPELTRGISWVIPDLMFVKPDCTLWAIQGNDTIQVRLIP